MSVTDQHITISDRSNSIFILSLNSCLSSELPVTIPSTSIHMSGLAVRGLHTYCSGGEIIGIHAGLTCLVFGVNMHVRSVQVSHSRRVGMLELTHDSLEIYMKANNKSQVFQPDNLIQSIIRAPSFTFYMYLGRRDFASIFKQMTN